MTETKSLRQQLADPSIVVAPGVYDALSALLAERAGFQTLYLSGASIAYSRLGRSDVGLVDLGEVVATIGNITDRIQRPVIVDADTGFGNALNVIRTIRMLERAGAAGIQLEDQVFPKRCGHLNGKSVIPTGEMVGKIKAALDARRNSETWIIARTDAVAVEGLEAALDRAEQYAEAGADMLFVEAPRSTEHLDAVVDRLGGRVPLIANIVEGGKTPTLSARELEAKGFSLVIFPGGLARALSFAAQEYFASLKENGSTQPYRDRMLSFDQLNQLIGTPELLSLGARYENPEED